MDVSSAGGALAVTLLRLLHIVAGLIWVGAAMVMSLYIEPALEKSEDSGTRFLRALYSMSGFSKLIPLAAIITTLAGLLLYGVLSYHNTLNSSMGIVLTAGAVFGLLAFAHGLFAVWRNSGKYAEQVKAAGDTPPAAQRETLQTLAGKLRRNGRVSMWLALVSLVLMAGARYIGPIFG